MEQISRLHEKRKSKKEILKRSNEPEEINSALKIINKTTKQMNLVKRARWRNVQTERHKLLQLKVNNEQYIAEQLLQIALKLDTCSDIELKTRCSEKLFAEALGNSNSQAIIQRVCTQVHQILFHRQFKRWEWLMQLNREVETYVPALYLDRARDIEIISKEKYYWRNAGLKKVERANKWKELLIANAIEPIEFAQAIYDWLEQKDHKKNTLFIHGQISTGKTLLANAFRGCFLHRQISNSSVTGNFALGNCCQTHIIIYEEPFLHPLLAEDFKSLASGAEITCDYKFQVQQPLLRTPLLITSNTLQLGHGHVSAEVEEAIQKRSYIFHFKKPVSFPNYTFFPIDLAFFLSEYNDLIKQ